MTSERSPDPDYPADRTDRFMVVEVVISRGRPTETAATIADEAVRLVRRCLQLAPQVTSCSPLPRGGTEPSPLSRRADQATLRYELSDPAGAGEVFVRQQCVEVPSTTRRSPGRSLPEMWLRARMPSASPSRATTTRHVLGLAISRNHPMAAKRPEGEGQSARQWLRSRSRDPGGWSRWPSRFRAWRGRTTGERPCGRQVDPTRARRWPRPSRTAPRSSGRKPASAPRPADPRATNG